MLNLLSMNSFINPLYVIPFLHRIALHRGTSPIFLELMEPTCVSQASRIHNGTKLCLMRLMLLFATVLGIWFPLI